MEVIYAVLLQPGLPWASHIQQYHLQPIHIFQKLLRAPPHCSSPWSRSSNASWTPSVASINVRKTMDADGLSQGNSSCFPSLRGVYIFLYVFCHQIWGDACKCESIWTSKPWWKYHVNHRIHPWCSKSQQNKHVLSPGEFQAVVHGLKNYQNPQSLPACIQ